MGRGRVAGWLVAAALLAGIATAAPAQEQEPQLVRMGTGSLAGVYYPVGVALCRLANQHRRETNLRCAAEPSAGSVANIGGLRDGTLDMAIVQSDNAAAAVQGQAPFAEAGPFADLRSVMALYPEPLAIVARADAGIAQVEDLAGKRVALGIEGSGTRTLADALMGALGWTPASFAATPDVAPEGAARALCNGEIDAFLYAVGQPALAIQEATTTCDATLIAAAGPAVDEMVAAHPDFVAATIPGGLYKGTDDAVRTFGVEATLVSRAGVADDTVYAIVRSIFEDIDMLRGLDPVLAGLDEKAMVSTALAAPVHPGAERYYRERGWLE